MLEQYMWPGISANRQASTNRCGGKALMLGNSQGIRHSARKSVGASSPAVKEATFRWLQFRLR